MLQKTLPKKLKHAACRTDCESANLRNVYRPADELDNADSAFTLLSHRQGCGLIESARLVKLPEHVKKIQRLPLDYEDEDPDLDSEYAAFFFCARVRTSSAAYDVTDEGVASHPRLLYACVYTMIVR